MNHLVLGLAGLWLIPWNRIASCEEQWQADPSRGLLGSSFTLLCLGLLSPSCWSHFPRKRLPCFLYTRLPVCEPTRRAREHLTFPGNLVSWGVHCILQLKIFRPKGLPCSFSASLIPESTGLDSEQHDIPMITATFWHTSCWGSSFWESCVLFRSGTQHVKEPPHWHFSPGSVHGLQQVPSTAMIYAGTGWKGDNIWGYW